MGLFSLDWFKSSKQKELEKLKVEEQAMKNALLRKKLDEADSPLTVTNRTTKYTPYHRVKLVNNVLTVTLHGGEILSKSGATEQDFNNIRGSVTEDQVISFMVDNDILEERREDERKIREAIDIKTGFEILKSTGDFDIEGNVVYFKGIHRTVPQLLVEKFSLLAAKEGNVARLMDNVEYQSLKRFFMWCCLNPRAEVADKLYNFLMKNSFRITKQGFFVALRNVVTIGDRESKELVHFVSNAYNKIKGVWKKNPDNYRIVDRDGDYYLEKTTAVPNGAIVGNLTTLYLDLPNMIENRYTDAHTRTFDIRIGRAVNMDPADCRWNTDDCGAEGLHFTANEIHYVGCGDTSVLVLINPMKVVGIGESKGRCWEYFPLMTVPREEATEILKDLDFDTLELDEHYIASELENLEERAMSGFSKEVSKHEFNVPAISTIEVEKIVTSLDQIKKELSKRVVNV